MLTLTAVTGMLDAVGYLGLDRVFTGNMTGNIVILGMGVVAADNLPVVGPLVALIAYAVGAAVAGSLLRARARAWTGIVTAIFATSAAVLAAVAGVLALFDVEGGSAGGVAVAGTIALLMGVQAATARFLAVTDLTTVVVTSTLTAYAAETVFAGGLAPFAHRRLWALVAIFAGAVVGALLIRIHISVPVFVAALLTGGAAVIGHRERARF